jgi:anaerobic ribonucleoside-triphosphate reductase
MKPMCEKCGKEKELIPYKEGRWVCHTCKTVTMACEVYSRVCGYLRPVSGWNKGKKEEFMQRKTYKVGADANTRTES